MTHQPQAPWPHIPISAAWALAPPLTQTSSAMLVVDGGDRVLGGNPAGVAQFGALLGAIEGDRLAFRDAACAEALATARRRLRQDRIHEVIVRFDADAGGPLFALLSGGGDSYALLLPPPARTEALASALISSFGLTRAETRLALKLQGGLSLAECGRDLDISVNTARNQLRAIFEKLGLRRQSELARTLAQLAALANG
ncbi:helix-turn-helix transcriptional regulator [Phenylobacterium sp.]|uniref:helix-turn-helix transcriptional regulator n=1 Tax=Phenylobacterium sp. TaxID=1871053 RepID=UPI0027312313|nr:helix-turn-helix transcriptional regulator [Phenylobacterium sp.]MDP1617669.1 helix-turn-helix transcriptional regulator [Phenylobacterium sp.]MDP1988155.1 helix-turn-helix transcriptional regulator [Phenylobacterium sp.]